MKRNGKLGKIIIVGVILVATGTIVAIGLGMDDGKPQVQPLSREKAEAVQKVMQNRNVIARFQTQARAQYNVNEYAQVQYSTEWDATENLEKKKRDAERKILLDRARADIKQRQGDYNRALENYRSGNSTVNLNTLRRTASDNLDLGLRIATLSVSRQEAAIRARKLKFNAAKDKMDDAKREAEEAAINKQQEACNKRKTEINLVRANRGNVIATVVRQANAGNR